MVDSGSMHSFITNYFGKQAPATSHLERLNYAFSQQFYNSHSRPYYGHFIDIGCSQLTVVNTLVSNIIIAMDILARYETVELATGGDLPRYLLL